MRTKLEGLVLSKTPYRERHLICRLLLRNGKKVSIIFWGGQGGGKKLKGRILEIGHMIKLELTPSRSQGELYSAREWSPVWIHQKIRFDYQAFCLLCFFVELVDKLALPDNLREEDTCEKGAGIFGVLANGVFQLEKQVGENSFSRASAAAVFLSKLLIEQGIFPTWESCALCGQKLREETKVTLMSEQGGLSCCDLGDGADFEGAGELWRLFQRAATSRYSELEKFSLHYKGVPRQLLHYLCYQLSLDAHKLKARESAL